MTSGVRGGSWLHEEGHRLCVLSNGAGSLKKTSIQGAFGDFGHIVQIETPKPGLAFVVFRDKVDANDALSSMDGESVDGQTVSVSRAAEKPKPPPSEEPRKSQVLMSTTQGKGNAKGKDDIRAGRRTSRSRNRSPVEKRHRSRSRSRSPAEQRHRNQRQNRTKRHKSRSPAWRSRSPSYARMEFRR